MSKTMKICIGAGVTILIVAAVILGVLLAAYPLGVSSTPATTMPVSPATEEVTTGLSAEPISSSEQISLKAFATTSTDESGEEVSSVTLTATISPAEAAEFVKCDWTLAWEQAPINGSNPVENYISMTVPEDGSKTVTLTLVQEFLSDSAIVTCTIRGTSYQASVLVKNTSEPTFVVVTNHESLNGYIGSYYDDELNETVYVVNSDWSIEDIAGNFFSYFEMLGLELQNEKGYVSDDWEIVGFTGVKPTEIVRLGSLYLSLQKYNWNGIVVGSADGDPITIDFNNAPSDNKLLEIYNYIEDGGRLAVGDQIYVGDDDIKVNPKPSAVSFGEYDLFVLTAVEGGMVYKCTAYCQARLQNTQTIKDLPCTIYVRVENFGDIEIDIDGSGEIIL